jgi:hypothetical protein
VKLESWGSKIERGDPSSSSRHRFSFTTMTLLGNGFRAHRAFCKNTTRSPSDKCPRHHWHQVMSNPIGPLVSNDSDPACPNIALLAIATEGSKFWRGASTKITAFVRLAMPFQLMESFLALARNWKEAVIKDVLTIGYVPCAQVRGVQLHQQGAARHLWSFSQRLLQRLELWSCADLLACLKRVVVEPSPLYIALVWGALEKFESLRHRSLVDSVVLTVRHPSILYVLQE